MNTSRCVYVRRTSQTVMSAAARIDAMCCEKVSHWSYKFLLIELESKEMIVHDMGQVPFSFTSVLKALCLIDQC